jgi:3-methylcrotonyl-CoA carboxylase alpha subunit
MSTAKLFDKVLIANRGEIACRVMRTAKRLGIKTVAVYSDADRHAQHVQQADEAVHIGPAASAESYLVYQRILEAADDTGAQAVHPGYGFLSENATFARACADAGVTFIGPPEQAILDMGSKSASKDIMIAAGVPVTPGYHGEDQSLETLKGAAEEIGYPVMIKAVLGGGGKGMRICMSADKFEESLASCKREAAASFGDDRVLIEKFLVQPRHVELQVFADTHGNAVHLFERDCSVQRRHQKVLEEAPAPGMTEELRAAMGGSAVDAAKAVGYVGAGTVEFMLDGDGSYYFMEMNTRLQVEHPVTEMVTGQDLVEWQLRVAAGMPLPVAQEELKLKGHAIEARVYAENPRNNFLPGTGTLSHLVPPQSDDCLVRVDTGVVEGDEVSVFYDPMISKLITWGADREEALRRMKSSLDSYQVAGLPTNIDFLARCVTHPAFAAGGVDTSFLDKHLDECLPESGGAVPDAMRMAAIVGEAARVQAQAEWDAEGSADPTSPWGAGTRSRVSRSVASTPVVLTDDNGDMAGARVTMDEAGSRVAATLSEGAEAEVATNVAYTPLESGSADVQKGDVSFEWRGTVQRATIVRRVVRSGHAVSGIELTVFAGSSADSLGGARYTFAVPVPDFSGSGAGGGAARVSAPMPGKVIKLNVSAGDEVNAGDVLMILEAMKMEHAIEAPMDGVIGDVLFGEGDFVGDGAVLVSFQDEEAEE